MYETSDTQTLVKDLRDLAITEMGRDRALILEAASRIEAFLGA